MPLLRGALLALMVLSAVARLPWPSAPNNTLRPIFHVPADGAMGYVGDANGMMYRNNMFHLFWQCWVPCNTSAPGPPETPMCNNSDADQHELWWCHAVSVDHVRWFHLGPAIGPGAESGGAAQVHDSDVVALFHDFGGGGHWQARPRNTSDPLLRHWRLLEGRASRAVRATLHCRLACKGLPTRRRLEGRAFEMTVMGMPVAALP